MKKVAPAAGKPWIMLLGIDFASNKAFSWDLDVDKAKMQDVQSRILRYAQEFDLMAVNLSDSGGQFKNILEEAQQEVPHWLEGLARAKAAGHGGRSKGRRFGGDKLAKRLKDGRSVLLSAC